MSPTITAYELGIAAYKDGTPLDMTFEDGKRVEGNPFNSRDDDWRRWRCGWRAACFHATGTTPKEN